MIAGDVVAAIIVEIGLQLLLVVVVVVVVVVTVVVVVGGPSCFCFLNSR